MYREFYSALGGSALPIYGLFFFLLAFALVWLRTFVTKRRHDFDAIAALPLSEDTPNSNREVQP